MSHALIARNTDLRKLEDEGYSLSVVDDAFLLIENVPYVTVQSDVREGTLVMKLTLSGDCTVQPTKHVAYWIGEFPYEANGNRLLALVTEDADKISLSDSIPPAYQFSAKPDDGYKDYHHKVTTYVDILSREARLISPGSTAQQYRVVTENDSNNVFNFADTASARQNTIDLAREFQHEQIAIVGVGGTGSYVLDLVAKTWARQIELFDDDQFLQHNAFRSPGPFSRDELEGHLKKSVFHAERYSRMRDGIIVHDKRIDDNNVHQLGTFDTVFLCIDGHPIKSQILDTCMSNDTLLIDVGMGLYRVDDSIAGIIRTTTCLPDHFQHTKSCIDLAGDDAAGEYERNIQLAELNALNAALAVIKWKKVRGFYSDLKRELNSEYAIDGNMLINSDSLDE